MNTTVSEAQKNLASLVDAVNSRLQNKYTNKVIGGRNGQKPRFELYHAAPSLCSHKVRTVLAEKRVPYVSHDMNIMPAGNFIPENYRPDYVRLRLKGAPNAKFVDGYTGESSVSNQGFDPCVVPTLIDHEKARVVIDSRVICEYIDAEAGEGPRLIPDDLAEAISGQDTLIDEAPHVASLYGAHPDGDDRPMGLRKNIAGIHAKKIRVLKTMIDLVGDSDPEVVAAYQAKIKKEDSAGAFVVDDEGMRETHKKMAEHVIALERELNAHDQPWVCGDQYTLADVMWTCSIWRMQWLGFGHLWADTGAHARLNEYLDRAFARPGFRNAVVNWPGAHGPSPHVAEHKGPAAVGGFALHMLRGTKWREVIWGDPEIKLQPLEEIPSHR